jgi:hypothetical protein
LVYKSYFQLSLIPAAHFFSHAHCWLNMYFFIHIKPRPPFLVVMIM